ncbi:MAG TPA: replication-relaxation family protein [Mycobacteriales bacterium]|nr:replication-relaxation family protein [Mycobacteriales bacterium]
MAEPGPDADRALVRAAWSLGYAPRETLHALGCPSVSPGACWTRLRRLHRSGRLVLVRRVGSTGSLWLYGVGRGAAPPGSPRPWRPGLPQLEHTLAVGAALVTLTRVDFAAPLACTEWQGEAELRAWAAPGAPYPDGRVGWTCGGRRGAWLLELDRATESRAAWRRKLVRYLVAGGGAGAGAGGVVLAVTTSAARARGLALVAADLGVPLLATTAAELHADPDPVVLDALERRRDRLVAASTRFAAPGG